MRSHRVTGAKVTSGESDTANLELVDREIFGTHGRSLGGPAGAVDPQLDDVDNIKILRHQGYGDSQGDDCRAQQEDFQDVPDGQLQRIPGRHSSLDCFGY